MTIVNTVASKFVVAFVAVAMLFTLAMPAQAQTLEEQLAALQEQYNTLLAQLGGGGDDMMSSGSSSTVCPYQWTRDLTLGASGDDVMKLQMFLMDKGQSIPAGPTDYFGGQTQSALASFQAANGISPAVGYFGPVTRGVVNPMCAAAPVVVVPGDDSNDDDGNDDDDDSSSSNNSLSGSADLDTYEIDDAEDDEIEEGQEDQPVAEIDIEFDNGDALVKQVELGFELNSGQTGAESDPWDTFETVSLWLDGDMIASLDVDDEDDWEGGDENELTFSRLDIFAEEDEEVTLIVAVSTQNGLDFDSSDDTNTWTVSLETFGNISINEGLRFEDADGFVSEDGPTGDDDASFDIEEEGAEDELDVRSSDIDPDSTVLPLEDDSDTTHVVFAFELDAEESENDIEFDQLVVDFTVSSGTLTDFVDDAVLIVDGSEVDTEDETVNAGNVTFDFDGSDFVIAEGDKVDVEVELEFNSLDLGNEGVTIQGSMTGNATKIDAEGADDLDNTNINGSATGDEHTLRTTGLIFDTTFDGDDGIDDSFDLRDNSDSTTTDDEGVFDFTFSVEAFEDDAFINDSVASGTGLGTAGIMITLVDTNGNQLADGDVTDAAFTITNSTADQESSGRYRIDEGESETFTVQVVLDPAASGFFGVQLQGVAFNETDANPDLFQAALPTTDFDTNDEFISN